MRSWGLMRNLIGRYMQRGREKAVANTPHFTNIFTVFYFIQNLIDQIEIRAKLNDLQRFISCKHESTESLPSTFSSRHDTIRLPKMKIKQFSGDPAYWVSFFDSFEAAVDSNENLAKVEEMIFKKLFSRRG